MKTRFRICIVGAISAWLTLAAAAQGVQQGDYIVAVVGADLITNFEVETAVHSAVEQLQKQGQKAPEPARMRKDVLERLINERAQLQYAAESGVRADDEAIDLAEQSMARQNQIDVTELRSRMAKMGVGPAKLRTELRDQVLLSRLRERDIDSKIKITDQDIDQYLADLQRSNPDPFVQDINLAQLLIALPENASEQTIAQRYAQAQKLLQRLRQGEDFAALVQQYSAADRKQNGEMGLRHADRYPVAFVQAVQKLDVGGVSDIVRTNAGFHILKLLERHRASVPAITILQLRVRHILLRTGPELSQQDALARLADFRQRIVNGTADFQALARQYSQDGSAPQGGDLGWAGPGTYVPEFEDVIEHMDLGQISAPAVSRFGVHLIQLVDRRRVEVTGRELREYARNQLRKSKSDEAYALWAKDIRERTFVELRDVQ